MRSGLLEGFATTYCIYLLVVVVVGVEASTANLIDQLLLHRVKH